MDNTLAIMLVFSTFEMGNLAMWMMENVRYLSEHLFLAELSPCRTQMSRNLSPPKNALKSIKNAYEVWNKSEH